MSHRHLFGYEGLTSHRAYAVEFDAAFTPDRLAELRTALATWDRGTIGARTRTRPRRSASCPNTPRRSSYTATAGWAAPRVEVRPHQSWRSDRVRARARRWSANTPGWRTPTMHRR
ncbi:hypothetical protein OHA72_29255 [Dactylosporangium sp. NBC_01737]|uniref:hypothetical protein n=1 Tax=Dactylosporangium sp. NBC_01737 TaxID=2975959 RepID=UPI002E1262B3|nr:hypothetical protein OHA72_29255 [Dactylosporangium sp. NBC_01737]